MSLGRYLLNRLGLALLTLWLLSVLVFLASQVLPGDVGSKILGPTADKGAIAALNAELGLDRPPLERYLDFATGLLRGDFGESYSQRRPVGPMLLENSLRSLKLATVAFVIVVPLAVGAGVLAAMMQGRAVDRAITTIGLAAMVVPEFVSGIVVILVFSLWLKIFPVSATAPAGSGILTQVYHLLLPVMPLVFVMFGYIERVTRASTIEVLASDYVRTATLKGLGQFAVIRHHVLRNALPSSVTVVATQVGYMFGGLVVIEILFNYNGIGLLLFKATRDKDFPLLASCVMVIGVVYLLFTLLGDVIHSLLDPRFRVHARK